MGNKADKSTKPIRSPMVSIEIGKAGWGSLLLTGREGVFENRISNVLADTVGEFVAAVCSLCEDEEDSFCVFDEPGTYWICLLPQDKQVAIDVYYDCNYPLDMPNRGKMKPICRLVFETADFVSGVIAALREIHELYGIEEYKKLWNHNFPLKQLEALESAASRIKAER
jgi:hypothetical protein